MKKFVIQIILLIGVIGFSLVFFNPTSQSPKLDLPFLPQPAVIKQLQINDAKFKVEIADTQAKRSQGLGGRNPLKEDEGMLFIFPNPVKTPFWMKGLTFPLDFIFIKDDKVIDIIKNAPPPALGQVDESLPIYQPKTEVDKVLEVNAGTVERLGIKVGDNIKISEL